MLFTSLSYLFFLSLTAAAYYLFPGRFRGVWLIVASVAYYLSFIPIFFALIGVLVIGNYFGGRWISKTNEGARGKKVLIVVIVLNVLVLAFFKYFHFFFPGLRVDLYFVDWFYRVDPITRMIIPLGLSYLIFTVIRTTTISRDVERWYRMRIRGQEDPFLNIGETNVSSKKGVSDVVYSLRDINFEVQQGEALGIIGNNGAGKSTLLKIISRVTSPTTRKIQIK